MGFCILVSMGYYLVKGYVSAWSVSCVFMGSFVGVTSGVTWGGVLFSITRSGIE